MYNLTFLTFEGSEFFTFRIKNYLNHQKYYESQTNHEVSTACWQLSKISKLSKTKKQVFNFIKHRFLTIINTFRCFLFHEICRVFGIHAIFDVFGNDRHCRCFWLIQSDIFIFLELKDLSKMSYYFSQHFKVFYQFDILNFWYNDILKSEISEAMELLQKFDSL